MVVYKPDCDSNDCELPNEKATPLILVIAVWLMRLHVGRAINRISYYSSNSCTWLGIGSLKNQENSFSTIDSCRFMHACMQVDQIHDNACMLAIASTYPWAKGVWWWWCILLFIAYSFSCNSFDCVIDKNSQFAIKRISHSKPTCAGH